MFNVHNFSREEMTTLFMNGSGNSSGTLSGIIYPTIANISMTMADLDEAANGGGDENLCDLKQFSARYKGIHGYISLVVCIFGTIANILNIVVLTRKEMNGSPINRILTGIDCLFDSLMD